MIRDNCKMTRESLFGTLEFLKIKSQQCKQAYQKQRNICPAVVQEANKNDFNILNVRNTTDNKVFENCKAFFLQ